MPFRKRLQDLEVREKESATFQCEVELPATEAAWYKEETRLWASAKYGIEEEGTERRLTVRNVSADDDAIYICETAEGSRTVAELAVQGGGGHGEWRGKVGREGAGRRSGAAGGLGAGRRCGAGALLGSCWGSAGTDRGLGAGAGRGRGSGQAGGGWGRSGGASRGGTGGSTQSEAGLGGEGAGEKGRAGRKAGLEVERWAEDAPPIQTPTSPRALSTTGNLIRKLPRKTAVRVGDTAMFCVELAQPEHSIHWLRNQEEVVAGGRVAITTEGACHTLTISKCSLEDMGEVTFMAGDCRTTTQFFVSGKGQGVPLEWTGPFPLLLSTGPRCTFWSAVGGRRGFGGWTNRS